MRKVLFYSILALSINAYAQIKPLSAGSQKSITDLKIDRHKNLRSAEGKIRSISLLLSQEKISGQKGTKASSSPVYDDIYMWTRDVAGKKWVYDSRTINLVYDVNSNLLSFVSQHWNGASWDNDQQVTYTYSANNLTGELWQIWSGGIWVNDYNYNYTYNSNNYISLELAQSWNGSSWLNEYQSLYSYDANNNKIKFTQQLWDGSAWANSYQEIFTYDTGNYLTNKLTQMWDGAAWTDSFRDTYTYDSGKKLTGILKESPVSPGVWENYFQDVFTYDANSNLTTDLMQVWGGSSWDNYSNILYTYDVQNNQKTKTTQEWSGSAWVRTILTANTYDLNNYVVSETNKNYTSTLLTSGDSTFYNIHTVITSLNELKAETLSLFPNPGTGKFTIKSNNPFDKIEIYNMAGERVYSDTKNKQQNSLDIDIRNCTKGIYLLKVYIGSSIINRKIIIK